MSGGGAGCGVCALHARADGPPLVAWSGPRWVLRHHPEPAPLAGWFLLDSRRCVQGPADLDDAESAEFGAVLRRAARAVRDAAGVPRVYVIMFGEGAPHLHAHIVPRDPSEPGSAAWRVADLYRQVERGERLPAASAAVAGVVSRVHAAMRGT